jgi:DNA-binding transcriptional LysR family regulator
LTTPFEQLGKKIFLTPGGQKMLQFSRSIIERFREAEETLAQMRGVAGGSLNIGVVSAGGYIAPGLLAEFLRRNDGVKLELAVENRETLLKQLDDNVQRGQSIEISKKHCMWHLIEGPAAAQCPSAIPRHAHTCRKARLQFDCAGRPGKRGRGIDSFVNRAWQMNSAAPIARLHGNIERA